MNRPDIDPTRCPLCGAENRCGMQAGASKCWCFALPIDADVLARVPPEAQNRACICEACATRRPPPVSDVVAGLLRRR